MKRKRFLLLLVCLALTCVFLPGCTDQEEAAPAITGTVCDAETNEPLSDVTVTLTCTFPEESEGTNPTVTTGTDGSFQLEIPDDTTGLTSVFLEKEGYEAVTQELPEGTPAAQDLGTISLQAIKASSKEVITDVTESDWRKLEEMIGAWIYVPFNYDCAVGSAAGDMVFMMGWGSYWEYFPDEIRDWYEDQDPKGQFDTSYVGYGYGYYKLDALKCDWILQNIYHANPDHSVSTSLLYYSDGCYYVVAGGDGWDYIYGSVTDYEQLEDGKYYISYDIIPEGYYTSGDSSIIEDQYMVADLELIDGKRYWTFYQTSDEPISEYEESETIDQGTSADAGYTADAGQTDPFADFLSQKQYAANLSAWENEPTEYALLDIDQDGTEELILRSVGLDGEFFENAVYRYDTASGTIQLMPMKDRYGEFESAGVFLTYGDIEYSSADKGLAWSYPRTSSYIGSCETYCIQNGRLTYAKGVSWEGDQNWAYSAGSSDTLITASQQAAYFMALSTISFQPLP